MYHSSEESLCRFLIFRTRPIVFESTPECFLRGSPMPFADFSGPLERLGEPARKLFRRKSYAVSSLFGPAQSSSGARPKAFSGEVLCRLLIFRVHPSVSASQPERFFGGSPMPFPHFSGRTFSECSRKLLRGKSYAVCPKQFRNSFPEEVLCRLLIFRVRTADFGSTPDSFF